MSRTQYKTMTGAVLAALAAMVPQISSVPIYRRNRWDKAVHDQRTSRYMPHQGEQERARRRRQMAKAYGKNPVVRFYASMSGGDNV